MNSHPLQNQNDSASKDSPAPLKRPRDSGNGSASKDSPAPPRPKVSDGHYNYDGHIVEDPLYARNVSFGRSVESGVT